MALPRQNFHAESEATLNKLINLTLNYEYVYMAMAFYFNRDDINLPNMTKFFKHCACEKRETLEKLLSLQNTRGGRIVLMDITKPEKSEFGSCVDSMKHALDLEKKYNQAALDFHVITDSHSDPQLSDWIESHLLSESVGIIKTLSDHIGQLTRVGNGLGEYQFDVHTLSN
ncbi:Soma ferritin [Trichoplax sp. H2]|uniref:Ferritin n=1 Tax=Trichoplax adhaerens TaxID=10228 RepID=B3RZS9_TRIAD|nr:expressed hypothetical protein [Trichoplax adhaerens]EDV24260.1 expressed hypothetical protein [Trichoplax adhaerens]RDD44030.1 Soma ferritin [Trichoplax sp. H2]|eukprot:XP_002113786.1 expressed hypothetical protein [Trichoplax adhaerens]